MRTSLTQMDPNDSTRLLPTGIVTFMFTDIEASTELAQRLPPAVFAEIIDLHHEIVRSSITQNNGVEIRTEGDSFFAVFTSSLDAIAAAAALQRLISNADWPHGTVLKVRAGLHMGEGILGGDNYVGIAVHKASRIANAAHGGQVTMSAALARDVASELPDGIHLVELGKFRLAGFQEPEAIAQLAISGLPHEFPPLRGVSPVSRLPEHRTSFIGREEQLSEGERLLDESRLVTLTGPGGTGKTRLSIELARRVETDFPDGVFFVSLAATSDPELIPSTVLEGIGLRTAAKVDPEDRLLGYVTDKTMLLLLDNMEQLFDQGAEFVARILDNSASLKILATSRAPLRIMGERDLAVPPLPVPNGVSDIGRAAGYAGVSLFVQRAATVRPGFSLTEENLEPILGLVKHLDGLPLALELAASQMRALTPSLVLERMSNRMLRAGGADLPARQQTMANAIGWSYELLDDEERRVFERCSVFSGSFALDEAERVLAVEEDFDVLDSLVSLVENSLLEQEASRETLRFRMLIVIKDYATDALTGRGDSARVEHEHANAYLDLAETASAHLLTSTQGSWLERLTLDHDNLRTAFDWAVREQNATTALNLVSALWRFWQMRGHLPEARQRAEAALAIGGGSQLERARCLMALGGIRYWQGDWQAPLSPFTEALEIFERHDDDQALADAMYNLAFPVGFTGDFERAEQLLRGSLEISQESDDRIGVGRAWWGLGNMAMYREDWDREISLMEKAVENLEGEDAPFDLGWAYYLSAFGHHAIGDDEMADKFLQAALEIFAEVSDMSAMTLILEGISLNALRNHEELRAAQLAGAASRIKQDTGVAIADVSINQYPQLQTFLDEGDNSIDAAYAQGFQMTVGEAIELARS